MGEGQREAEAEEKESNLLVQYLLRDKKGDPLCYADYEMTPLHFACSNGHTSIVMELLEHISTFHSDKGNDLSKGPNSTPSIASCCSWWAFIHR